MPEVVFPVAAPSQSVTGFKTVPVALTVGGGVHNYPATQGGVRIPVNFGATIKRWRLHIRNINPRQGEPGAGNVTISSVYIGRHGGNGTVSGGNTLVGGAMSSSSGSDMVTPWSASVIDASYEYLISYGWTSTAQPKQVVGGGYTTTTVDGAFSNAEPTTRSVNLPLDVWIEAEVEADVPVIAGFGDSLTSGVGAVLPVFNSWLSAYCRTQKAIPVHYSASGDTMAGWSDPEHYKWTRWEEFTRPDAVVHAMGSNDVFGGASLAEMQSRFRATTAILAEKVTPVIHAATIMPREGSQWDPMEQVRRNYNSWLAGRTRDLHDFVGAVSLDDETLIDSIDADGIHLTAAGYQAVAGAITTPLASTPVQARLSALERDTGWRIMPAFTGAASDPARRGVWRLRRRGPDVSVQMIGVGVTGTAQAFLGPNQIPAGFTLPADTGRAVEFPHQHGTGVVSTVGAGHKVLFSDNDITWRGFVRADGSVTQTAPTDHTGLIHGLASWTTDDPWPTTLPGTPA